MSDTQKLVNPSGGEIDQSTTLEISGAPNNKSKPNRASSSNNSNRNRSRPNRASSSKNNNRSRSNRTPSSKNNNKKKKPASQQQRQPAQNKHEKTGKLVTAEPQPTPQRQRRPRKDKAKAGKRTVAESTVSQVNKPAAETKQINALTAASRGSKNRKQKPEKEQARQELQVSVSEPFPPLDSGLTEHVTLPVSTEPIADTPPAEPEVQTIPSSIEEVALSAGQPEPVDEVQDVILLQQDVLPDTSEPAISLFEPELDTFPSNIVIDGAYPFIEVEQETSFLDFDLDDTSPRIKAVSTPLVEAEPELSPLEVDLDDTLPRIKAVTTPLLEPEPEVMKTPAPTPVPAIPQRPERGRVLRKALVFILLVTLIGSSFLLWRDINDTHLHLYAFDPASGQTLAQQDLGGGYQGDTTFTDAIQPASSLAFGVQTSQSSSGSKQQLFSLTGNDTSWKVEAQFSAPLSHGTLSLAPNMRLVVVHADGMQVMTTGGHVLWQMQGDEPIMGAHPFHPAFANSTLYTVKSAQNGVVAAYDLQSGAVRWNQKLDDTLEYAAPFLVNDNMLFIAADHALYALNIANGTLFWKADRPARTLLMLTEGQPLLLAAGPQGLAALNASTGAIAWSFNGQPTNTQASTNETLAPAQFYQASIASTNHVMYATGIVWDAQQVREQLWLFAVDATTGNVRWSERIGSDFTSADAGRIYPPSVDTTHGLVILQQAQDDGKHIIAAYDTGDGTQRWSVQLVDVTAAAPSPLQVSNTALILLDTQSSSAATLHSWSLMRLLLIDIAGLSLLWMLLLWMLPFQLWIKRVRAAMQNLPRYLVYPLTLPLRLWRFSRTVCALVLLVIFVWGGALLYAQLASPQNYLNQVSTSNGFKQWQVSTNTSVQIATADTQGSIVITSAGQSLHQLTSFGPDGISQWTSFTSEGGFSLPIASTQPGTVLVALSGRASPQYRFAPGDPAYAHPLDSLYTLYLLDHQTGQIIWQNTIISPEGQQDTTVLGADTKFIYVASRATNSLPPGIGPVVQLIAVDKTSGNIVWRIFGPIEPDTAPTDYGSLLLRGRSIIWQVSNTIYELDTMLGQIQWHKYIPENLPQASLREEAQMAEAAGVLLVMRSDAYHALDLATGNERWAIASPDNATAHISGGVVAVNNIFLLYGGGTLQAVDPADQLIIWSQKQLKAIQNLKISDDGTLVYAIIGNTLPGSPTSQVLVALDTRTGTAHWTFQTFEQEQFVNAQSDGFQYSKSTLYATICLPANQTSCDHEVLYAINAATGEKEWKFEANGIYNVHVSAGGDLVAFQAYNSAWGNLIEHFMS
jgi:outer membrane protein assembly factor BamB